MSKDSLNHLCQGKYTSTETAMGGWRCDEVCVCLWVHTEIHTVTPIYRTLQSIYRIDGNEMRLQKSRQRQSELQLGHLHGYIGSTQETDLFKAQSFIPDKEKYSITLTQQFYFQFTQATYMHTISNRAVQITTNHLPEACTNNQKCQHQS